MDLTSSPALASAAARLAAGAKPTPTGCLEWTRALSDGYGVLWCDGALRRAHRVAWLLEYGEWPTPGLVVVHICNNKRCVNVAHLRLLMNHENLRRAIPRGDAATEHRRAQWRRADAKRRGTYRYTEGGE